jgi:PIN domain nuclease of toxin-antitoxin system
LGARATAAIEDARLDGTGLHISCISTWEMYMLVAKGRLSLSIAPEVWVARCERLSFIRFHPLNNEIARLAVTACGLTNADPADRIVMATASYLGASVVTCDEKIRTAGVVKCVW